MYMDETDSFWLMSRVLSQPRYWRLSQLYLDGFPLLHRFEYMMAKFIKKLYPRFYKHLKTLACSDDGLCADPANAVNMILTTFLPQWFQHMFGLFQPPIVMRMWDLFLLEGPKVLFRVALGMIRLFKRRMKKMEFGDLIIFLRGEIYHENIDVNDFYNMIYAHVNITTVQMNKYSDQFKDLRRLGAVQF